MKSNELIANGGAISLVHVLLICVVSFDSVSLTNSFESHVICLVAFLKEEKEVVSMKVPTAEWMNHIVEITLNCLIIDNG